jgi:hypothetical protein
MNLWFVSGEGDGEWSTDDGSRICFFSCCPTEAPGSLDVAHESLKADFHLRTSCRAGARDFLFSKSIQTGSGAHLASCPMGIGFGPPGAKRPGREVNHPFPSSAEVKNKWSYTSTTPVCCHHMDRGNFTSTFTFTSHRKDLTQNSTTGAFTLHSFVYVVKICGRWIDKHEIFKLFWHFDMIWYDMFVNCNWVAIRWQ